MISRILSFRRLHRLAPWPATSLRDDAEYDDLVSDTYLESVLTADLEPEEVWIEREIRERSEDLTRLIERRRELHRLAGLRAA